MEIWQLKTFRAVAETLNFTKAAERLNLTQSAVSHQIKALETELGEPLFIRSKRGVTLSQAGKIALEHAEKILDEAENLREHITGNAKKATGSVRVAAATQALVYLFADSFEKFMREYEGIGLSFRTTVSTEQTVEDILNGASDVGFASLPIYSPSLQVTELFEDELVLVTSNKHKFKERETITLEELKNERLILFERGTSIRYATDSFFKRVNISPALALESNDTYFIKLMVEHGVGVSLMPSWAVREETSAGKLIKLKIEEHPLRRSVAMVSLAKFQPAPTRTFVSFMLAHKAELQAMANA